MQTSKTLSEKIRIKRDKADAIKLDKGCETCGYNDSPKALQFDHLGDQPKKNHVAVLISKNYSWDTIQAEIDKCRVLCANCHAIHSYETHPSRLGKT